MPIDFELQQGLSCVFTNWPTAQNSPELKIHIRNVARDTSVYYSVIGTYSRVHISWNEVFSKILKKSSILQK